MISELDRVSPPNPLHRIGRVPDPWRWNDWSHADSDGTFGNRWDDPESEYRVLYASSQRLACFLETIGRFPGDPKVMAGLDDIEVEEGEAEDALRPGELAVNDWLQKRCMGSASMAGSFASVGNSASLAYLRSALDPDLERFGLDEIDAAAIRSGRRELTQAMSRLVFERSTAEGQREFDGIRYLSRYGDEFENWAIFEPAIIDSKASERISPDDPDLLEAARRLAVTLV